MDYLDFEKPIKDILDQIEKVRALESESEVDMSDKIKELEKKLDKSRKDIYKNLTAWQVVQLSRHPQRPYTMAYIQGMTEGQFIELHGDRNVKDDKAMVGGLGKIGDQSFMFIGQQKGFNTKTSCAVEQFGFAIIFLLIFFKASGFTCGTIKGTCGSIL